MPGTCHFQLCAACTALALILCGRVWALETDQFTVPPKPLVDLGPAVSELVWSAVTTIVEETNARIANEQHKADISTHPSGRAYRLRQVAKLQSEAYLTHKVYMTLGKGFPESLIEPMVKKLAKKYSQQPALFNVDFDESILRSTGIVRPLNSVAIRPTIRLFDVYCGTEKLGHFFAQGYQYHKAYLDALADGHSKPEALRKAVQVGVDQEAGVYGYIPSGTYSNADLAANYAGFLFFVNLTRDIQIGDKLYPPLLLLRDGEWKRNPAAAHQVGENLLEPFISDHYSEAMNPPHYDWTMRDSIRREIRKRAPRWVQFHQTTHKKEIKRLKRMKTWHSKAYGHSGFEDVLTIVNVYFDQPEIVSK